jgi:MFS transporter, DHA1 family, multidrug resistance protein
MSAPPPETDRLRWVILLGALTALGPLAIDAYLPTLPTIQRELSSTAGAVQLTLSSYFLGLTIGQLIWGPLADRWGRKRPLVIGLSLYALGSLCCALAPSVELLAAARALQALGGSAGVVVVRAVVRDRWAGRAGADMMSSIVLVMGAAPILAPSLGGLILEVWSWRGIFALLAVAALAVLFALYRALPETHVPPAVRESLADAAKIVVHDRRFVCFGLASGFCQAGMFAYIAGSPFLFIEMLDVAPATFAILFGANASGFVLSSQLNRRLLRRFEHTTVAMGASVFGGAMALLFLLLASAGALSIVVVVALVFLFTASLALIISNATAAALEGQGRRAGLASAILGAAQFATAATASAMVGALADGTARPMALVMSVCSALAATGVLLGRATAVAVEPLRTSG